MAAERSPAYLEYKNQEQRLRSVRLLFGTGNVNEESVLDTMGDIWVRLTEEEKKEIDAEGTTRPAARPAVRRRA